jgi:hypothetical protein
MNNSTKVVIAVAGGYVLGRRHKAKMALLLGSWLLGKRLNFNLKQMGQDALQQLASTPEVAKLGGTVRDELVHAGRNAAVSVLSGRMDKLSDRLHEGTAALSVPARTRGKEGGAEGSEAAEEEEPRGREGRGRRQPEADRAEEERAEEEYDEEDVEEGREPSDEESKEDEYAERGEAEPVRQRRASGRRYTEEAAPRQRRRSAEPSREATRTRSDRPRVPRQATRSHYRGE